MVHRWQNRYENGQESVSAEIFRYDIPLGLGMNDPIDIMCNPLFADNEEDLLPSIHVLQKHGDTFLPIHNSDTTYDFHTVRVVRPQVTSIHSEPGNPKQRTQTDSGANIGITDDLNAI